MSSHVTRQSSLSFTLIELLVVMGIIALLMVLVVPAFTKLKSADEITNAAYAITGALEQARNYAMANETYVWIGFYEENTTAPAPTNTAPAYPGHGRLVMAVVASTDGTKIFDDSDPVAPLPPTRIKQISKLIKIEGIHLADIGAPPSSLPNPLPPVNSIAGRSDIPYTEGEPFSHFNRISSESADTTRFVFTTQGYTFYKTVRFSPRGEANINTTYAMKHVAEIGLRPTHGTVVDTTTSNVAAIQFNGTTGHFQIYRQ
jgi:Tfp pilus assembly protein FimT